MGILNGFHINSTKPRIPFTDFRLSDFQENTNISVSFLQIFMGCGGWAAKKSAKHYYVCDSDGCLGTTAHPKPIFTDFFTSPYSDISYVYFAGFLSHAYEYFYLGGEEKLPTSIQQLFYTYFPPGRISSYR
jgi:hypothetical protein